MTNETKQSELDLKKKQISELSDEIKNLRGVVKGLEEELGESKGAKDNIEAV